MALKDFLDGHKAELEKAVANADKELETAVKASIAAVEKALKAEPTERA